MHFPASTFRSHRPLQVREAQLAAAQLSPAVAAVSDYERRGRGAELTRVRAGMGGAAACLRVAVEACMHCMYALYACTQCMYAGTRGPAYTRMIATLGAA